MNMRPTDAVLIVFTIVVVWSSNAGTVAQQIPPEQPAFRSGVELVTVEVGVVDKNGRPVRDLRPEEFTITVAGRARRIVTAEYIQADTPVIPTTDETSIISTNQGGGIGRMFLFVVDSNTLEPGDARHVADATKQFFARLSMVDRSALVSLPIGRRVPFTWAHDRVREALVQASTTGGMPNSWEYGSLSEARDIATRGTFALREIASRECSTALAGSQTGLGGGTPGGGTPQSPGGGPGASGGSTRPGTGNQQPAGGSLPSGEDWAMDRCLREIQSQAEMTWSMARANSLASLTALRGTLGSLQQVAGDKTVILISGGWPMDESDETSTLMTVASEAAAARATVFTVYVPRRMMSAGRRNISMAPMRDQSLYRWGVENLASMTGGRSYSADADMQGVFDRISRELGGYYRIGVEKNAADTGATGRRMKVQVVRNGLAVRAREIFDVPTYADRDWPARLAEALESPVPASALALRLTSYLASDKEDPSVLRLLLAGEVARHEPGNATLQVLVRDLQGKRVAAGEQKLDALPAGTALFATNIRVPPGSYVVRLAVQDAAGRVGSVDHRVEAQPTSLGTLSVTGPILVHVAADGRGEPHFTVEGVPSGERLALELDLSGEASQVSNAEVTFEIAASADGPALLQRPARLAPTGDDESVLAQTVTDLRLLPPGRYLVRAKVKSGPTILGEVHRAFAVLADAPGANVTPEAGIAGTTRGSIAANPMPFRGRSLVVLPRFTLAEVLSRPVVNGFLTRLADRPDAASPGVNQLLERARSEDIAQVTVSEAQAVQTPIAAFVRGLSLLAQNKYDPAAAAFRMAMRASPDFYPAMVYLGACYAAAGNDKEAAAIWRTALIKEGASPDVHLLLADALLRQGSGSAALQIVNGARGRWPENNDVNRRFIAASILAGQAASGLQALDDLISRNGEDESVMALALATLYESLSSGRPIEGTEQDRARLIRLADVYRARGGPSLALVDTWVAAVKGTTRPPR
jgi:VWFA-related protein